jgi:hypothetical protein
MHMSVTSEQLGLISSVNSLFQITQHSLHLQWSYTGIMGVAVVVKDSYRRDYFIRFVSLDVCSHMYCIKIIAELDVSVSFSTDVTTSADHASTVDR